VILVRTWPRCARILLVIAATLAVVLCVAAVGGYFLVVLPSEEDEAPSLGAVQPYAERYVRLLDAGDEKGLRDLLGDPSAPEDAARRIAAYRALGLRDVHAALSDGPAGCAGDLPWFVIIKARTSDGTVVTMQEVMNWTYGPSHLKMEPLAGMDGRLVGNWRAKGSVGGGLMRVRWVGGSAYAVEFARFFRAPRRFVAVASNWAAPGGDPPGVIRYATQPGRRSPDVILLDLLSNSVRITGGRPGQSVSLVPARQ
jgi:hypothetical protein